MRLENGPFTVELDLLTRSVTREVVTAAERLDGSLARRDRADRSLIGLIGMMAMPSYARTLVQNIEGDKFALEGAQNRLAILLKVAHLNIAVRNDNGWAASFWVGREGQEEFEHDFLDLTYYPNFVPFVPGTPGYVVELNSEGLERESGEKLSTNYGWIVSGVLDIRRRIVEVCLNDLHAKQVQAQEDDPGFRRVVNPGY